MQFQLPSEVQAPVKTLLPPPVVGAGTEACEVAEADGAVVREVDNVEDTGAGAEGTVVKEVGTVEEIEVAFESVEVLKVGTAEEIGVASESAEVLEAGAGADEAGGRVEAGGGVDWVLDA